MENARGRGTSEAYRGHRARRGGRGSGRGSNTNQGLEEESLGKNILRNNTIYQHEPNFQGWTGNQMPQNRFPNQIPNQFPSQFPNHMRPNMSPRISNDRQFDNYSVHNQQQNIHTQGRGRQNIFNRNPQNQGYQGRANYPLYGKRVPPPQPLMNIQFDDYKRFNQSENHYEQAQPFVRQQQNEHSQNRRSRSSSRRYRDDQSGPSNLSKQTQQRQGNFVQTDSNVNTRTDLRSQSTGRGGAGFNADQEPRQKKKDRRKKKEGAVAGFGVDLVNQGPSNTNDQFNRQSRMYPSNPALQKSNTSLYSNPVDHNLVSEDRRPSSRNSFSSTNDQFNSKSRMYPSNPALQKSNTSLYSNPVDYNLVPDDRRPSSRNSFSSTNISGEMITNQPESHRVNDPNWDKRRGSRNNRNRGRGRNENVQRNEQYSSNTTEYNQNRKLTSEHSGKESPPLTMEDLESLLKKDVMEIIQIIAINESNCSNMFKQNLEPKLLFLVLELLGKVCAADSNTADRVIILQKASNPSVLDQIFNLVTELPYTTDTELLPHVNSFFDNLIILYHTFSDIKPSAIRLWRNHVIEVEKSMKAVHKNLNISLDSKLFSAVKSLLSDMDDSTTKDNTDNHTEQPNVNNKQREKYYPDPIGDFRTVSLYPRPEDIYGDQPFLCANIINGSYGSVANYLDIHFKLLREDFMGPIRKAIKAYKAQLNTKDKFKRIDNVRIYRRVKFLHPKTFQDKVCYEVCFDVDNKMNRVNWEFSNRFMFGSLLLFTNNDFDTFFLATVANRNVIELGKKLVSVELKETLQNAKSILGKEFIMAESEAYFEPYFNVMKALQMFDETNFPLAKYIVNVNTETLPPKYLSHEDMYVIGVANGERVTFTVLDDMEWPTHEDLNLDPSQYEAYKAALTNDLVVIQGPPGTGKTFLGLKIARTILQNSGVWNQSSSPILVVCLTNHALDQFLEGLLPVTSRLVRIGGKSKGSELDKFNIRERRREYSYYRKAKTGNIRALQISMSQTFAEIKTHQNNLQLLDDTPGLLSLKTLKLVMNDIQSEYFMNDDHLMDWLLAGVGKSQTQNKVKITVTADRGVVKETPVIDPLVVDAEDQRVKQAFFDIVDFDTSAAPSEETIRVHFACTLNAIHGKLNEILKYMNSRQKRNRQQLLAMKDDSDNLRLIIAHLTKELLEFKQLPRSEREKENLLNVRFLDSLKPNDRWVLYNIWVDILRNGLIVELASKEAEFRKLAFSFEQLRQADDIEILKASHVVGTTTNTAAKLQPMFTALGPKIVIVEEAAEVLEAHIIASLTRSCEHLILIGDHKQLRPNVAEMRLARQYQLDVSLFERMVLNGLSCHTLTIQHRMRPEISKQLVPTIYPTLEDHDSVREREAIKGMDKNVFFMTHNHFEEDIVDITSKCNHFEAEIMLKLARYLVQQGYKPSEITILATYKGQMYKMKNDIKNIEDFPKGIQITVVDNFQGEENKIILLSLVRSNAMNKIGFLEIENRVCVALSRARDGLYIVGNMDNLVASSDIWPHIKQSLVEQNAFGRTLQLRCQIHDKVTSINSGKDFSNVFEGGCNLLCGQPLPCGHNCKSMCHVSQDYHKIYRCKEPCPKILCQDGHQCPGRCYMKCELCKVLMRRDLPCGHFADVPCHMDIRQFECSVPVVDVIDLCKHTVTIPCHTKGAATCNLPCRIRMNCGHQCERDCHVNDDPDHLEDVCLKSCPRLRKNCSEDHKCRLACFEECELCTEKVQKQLLCGHSAKLLCSTDLDTYNCKQKCTRTLRCGHPCTKQCWEPCDPCPVLVEKTVPLCGHQVNIACSQVPTLECCDGQCVVTLRCGHKCAKRCRDTCSVDDCEHPKRFKITTLLCGHTEATLPCKKVREVRQMSQEELMQYCTTPCGQMLTCNHPCSGVCSECMQGRIHKMCDQPCGNVLICGHSCPVPCREVCPPCNQPCKYECKHSSCNRKCGEVCVPCNEPCDYKCEHLTCSKSCGEPCDREPCYEGCPLTLECTHQCVGFCGEPCPPCRQCEPEHFAEFFYTGEESEDDAKWVYLEDCKHTFESTGLEYWLNMEQEGSEIVLKACPRCKTPIVKVQRFMNLVKETYRDMQKVKQQCFGKLDDIRKQRLQTLKKLQETAFVRIELPPGIEHDELERLYNKLKSDLPEVKMRRRNAIDSQKVCLLRFQTEFFISLNDRRQESWERLDEESKALITKKVNFLTQLLRKREKKISEEETKSFELEMKRIHRLYDLLIYTSSPEYRVASSFSGAKNTRKDAEHIINSVQIYDDVLDEVMKKLLLKLKNEIKSSTVISDAERAMINKAMGESFHSAQKSGHWFKCKNGHVYCITECGGAMQEAMCPVRGCGEMIGGRHHALRADQAIASEMDGARHAAWSDMNNMANFGFQH